MYISRSDCHFPIVKSKIKTIVRSLIGVAATSRPEPVFFLVFQTSAGTSDEVGYGACRHVCDGGESDHEDLVASDHVHEDHDDHCSASGSEDCLV